MKQFFLRPTINEFPTCEEFIAHFKPSKDDLIFTNKYIYEPFFGAMDIPSHVIYMEDYGTGEPSDTMVEAIWKALPNRVERIIAIGGGGVLDVAKILSLRQASPVSYLFNGELRTRRDKGLILVPTTCGTGSEVTNISILALEAQGTKKGLVGDQLFADFAVLVPPLLTTLPFEYFATSSIDALVHAVESTLSPKSCVYTRIFSYRAIEMILRGFMKIREGGEEARIPLLDSFMLASNYAGIAFTNAGCAAVHALSYPLGAVYHVPHGEANYAMFIPVMRRYLEIKSDGGIASLTAFMSGILGCPQDKVFDEVEDILKVLLPRRPLREYGMTEADLQGFTTSVLENQQRLLANNFVPLDEKQILEIYSSLY